jgi:RNA polymerase sigma-70 factor (ECF subfamily)
VTTLHNRAPPAPLTAVSSSPSADPTRDAIAREGSSHGVLPRSTSRGAAPAARREDATFEQVFTGNAPFVWRALKRLGVREADVEDVCQEVFLVVHRQLPGFEARSSIRTWLYGICLRAASSYRRRPHRTREEIASTPPEESIPAPQDDDLERKRALARLDVALDELDDDKRAVFVLYELEQLSMAEIAEATGCPVQTAYSRLHAARRLVQASLERAYEERSSPSCR